MQKLIAAILAGLGLTVFAGSALGFACKGNACSHISISKSKGCVVLSNSHSTRAIAVMGIRTIPAWVYTVYPNSQEIPSPNGYCLKSWSPAGHEANFK